jgi:hypothetical protein
MERTDVFWEWQRVPFLGNGSASLRANIAYRIRDHEHMPMHHDIHAARQRMNGARDALSRPPRDRKDARRI